MPLMCCREDVGLVCANHPGPEFHSAEEARDWLVARFTRGVTNGWRSQSAWTRWLTSCLQKKIIVKRQICPPGKSPRCQAPKLAYLTGGALVKRSYLPTWQGTHLYTQI